MSFFTFTFVQFTTVMSFVGDLIDANMQKEMSEEVKAFEANVSNISV